MPDVLVIDHSPTSLNLLVRQIRELGFEPLVAREGTAGLALYSDRRPAAAVVDLMLPGELDGFAVLRRIRALDPAAAVVMVTADLTAERSARALELGATAVLPKPLDPADLALIFERLGLAAYLPH